MSLRARGWYVDVANYDKLAKQKDGSKAGKVVAVTHGPMRSEQIARNYAHERGYPMERVFFADGVGEAKSPYGQVRATVGVLKRLGWTERQNYNDGVVRMTRGAWSMFVHADGTCQRPHTHAQMLEVTRLCEEGVRFS